MNYEKAYKAVLKTATQWIEGGCSDKEKICLEAIFPELRESEDERALRIIKKRMCYDPVPISDEDRRIVDNWLEKQKEQEHICDSAQFEEGFKTGLEIGLRKQKEQKPVELNGNETSIAVKNPEAYKIGFEDGEAYAREELKQEWGEEDKMYLSQAIETLEHENYLILAEKLKSLRPQQHSWSKEDRNMLDIIISELEQEGKNANVPGLYHLEIDFLKSLKPQPKPEWGEVELEFRGEKVKVKRPFFRDDNGRGYSTTEQDDDAAWYAFRAWCEKKGVSLYDLYPRIEWSEADEMIRNAILGFLNPDKGGTKYSSNAELVEWSNWLKSLRPQPKQEWSEADEVYLEYALWCVEKAEKSCKDGEDKGACWSARRWLKSLRPQLKTKEEEK